MKKIMYVLFVLIVSNLVLAQQVTFKVNMSVKAKKGQFSVASDSVKIAGSFNGWNPYVDVLTKGATDTIYSITKTLTVGDNLEFKFVKGGTDWETVSNRTYTVPTGASTYMAWFDNDSIFSIPRAIMLNFECNMEFEKASGRFSTSRPDTLTVRGDFNGWSGNTLLQPGFDPNIFEGSFQDTLGVGETIHYKYAYITANSVTWENDPNKEYTITQADYDNGSATLTRTFNDLTIENVTRAPCNITFMVNMDTARSSVTGQPFSIIENVVIAGANAPLQWPGGGWPNEDSNKVFFLYNDGTHGDSIAGDKIWARTLTFPIYSPLRIQYKYGANWGLPSNTGANDNESSVGTDHFINLESRLLSASVRNAWSVMGDTPLYNVVTGVREIGSGIPQSFSLEQNYPNPFNPSTTIRFSIPQSGLVSLKIYDLLGQEVSVILNEFKNAGSYEATFDASKLNSGVYFYTISSSDFSSTRKMLLIK